MFKLEIQYWTRRAHNIGNKPAVPGNSCSGTQNPNGEYYKKCKEFSDRQPMNPTMKQL